MDYKSKSVLLVEDEAISRDVIRLFLRNICALDTAPDGRKAIEMTSQKQYDLILMDINLGRGISGIEAVKAIRSRENYTDTPIVAVTAYAMPGDKDKFISEGCSHYISKPFTKNSFIEFVTEILDEKIRKNEE